MRGPVKKTSRLGSWTTPPPATFDHGAVLRTLCQRDVLARIGIVLATTLQPLTAPERPFHTSAVELEALAAVRKGELAQARKMWNEIIKDTGAPQGAQQRAQALLTLYGPAEAK